jgi:hypothetical protein
VTNNKIVYPKSLKDIPPWRRRQITQDILWFSRFPPSERLEHTDREWAEIQDFVETFGFHKHDLFFHKGSSTIENERIEFEECYKNAILVEDPTRNIFFRVPSIDDLIRLKKIRPPNVKDEQDIEYLLKIKQLRKGGS